jgi:ABC-type glycerol-3-phosphate transport system substrate-binding protein
MNIRQITAAFLLFALLLSAAACGGDSGTPADVPEETSPAAEETTAAETTAEGPDLPDKTYGGETVHFLTAHNSGYDWYTSKEIFAEAETGELFNDAVYRRNLVIEDRFDIKITQNCVDFPENAAKKSLTAGDTEYDVVMPYMSNSISLLQSGLFYDLRTVPYLDLDKPWWDQRANDNLAYRGKLFMTTGDISILDNECTMVMFFNKQLVSDFGLESPYDLVRSGTWTMDKLTEMCSSVTSDVNGDGKLNMEDRFGLSVAGNAPISFYFAAGERILSSDGEGGLTITMNSPRASEVIEKVMSTCLDTLAYNNINGSDGGFDTACNMFLDSRLMFVTFALVDINGLRDAEFEFGILPYPKYNEAQEEYNSLISTICVPTVSLPYNCQNPELVGVTLSAMAYGSVDTLTVAYYDNALKTRYVRDDESGEMLDIIFSTRVYDFGVICDIGGLSSLVGSLYGKKSSDFASAYAKSESKAQAALEKLTASLDAVS